MPTLRVHLLPELIDGNALAGSRCVVIDVLRATTTIVAALDAGAQSVIPCLTIEDARQRGQSLGGKALLGGERGGLPIEGFDLGNSPAEYSHDRVVGRQVVLTTTNGTKALLHARGAGEILIGGFANLSAVCAHLAGRSRVEILCAGTDGHITRDDTLVAGAMAERLTAREAWELNDQAEIARDAWLQIAGRDDALRPYRVLAALRGSRGGRNLVAIGMQRDIELAAQIDTSALLPRFDPRSGQIVAT